MIWLAGVDWGSLFAAAAAEHAPYDALCWIASLRRRKAQLPDFAQFADDAVQRRMEAHLAAIGACDATPTQGTAQQDCPTADEAARAAYAAYQKSRARPAHLSGTSPGGQ